MNKQLKIAKYAQKVLDASLRHALGKAGQELLKNKQAKLIYIDGTWWLIDMLNRKVGEKDA
jgi:hypothetical protein